MYRLLICNFFHYIQNVYMVIQVCIIIIINLIEIKFKRLNVQQL